MPEDSIPVANEEPFLVFGEPDIQSPEIEEVVRCLESCWIGTGPRVAQFETDFSRYKGAPHVAAVNSCTAALHLSAIAAGVGPSDEVITTPQTFCATVNAIVHAGATPVLADVDPNTMNIDPDEVERRITSRTRAILPVHFAGRPCDMSALTRVAERNGVAMIEDCAHALETLYRGQHAGTFGDFGCFSFYATKNVTTGEGGMVVAKKQEHIERLKSLALHGLSRDAWRRFSDDGYKHYFVTEIGFKYNMTDLQAAIGIHQLRRVEDRWKHRQEMWRRYMDALSPLPLELPAPVGDHERHAFHLFTILIDEKVTGVGRDEFLSALTRAGIGSGVHYLSVPEHPAYQERFGWRPEDYPNAMRIGRQTLSLPLSAKTTPAEVDRVVRTVRRILDRKL